MTPESCKFCPCLIDFSRLIWNRGSFQATVQVEFRAPSSLVAERLAAQHEELVTGLTQLYSAPGCTGRRSLQKSIQPAPATTPGSLTEVAELRKQLQQSLESNKELERSNKQLRETVAEMARAATDREADRSGESKNGDEPAESPTIRRQVQQLLTETPEFSRVALPSGEIRACAVLPCELAGACLNGGDCVPGPSANDFTCHCLAGFDGPQCGDTVAASGTDPCGAGAIVNVPADGGGSGHQIAFEPAGGYPAEADCVWLIECAASVPGAQVTLEFVSFDTEPHYDVVDVLDGQEKTAPVLARALSGSLDGLAAGPAFTATGPTMTVHFRSDRQTSSRGFTAAYSCSNAAEFDVCSETNCYNLTTVVETIAVTVPWACDITSSASVCQPGARLVAHDRQR